jgi:hypothetical protein
MLYAMRIVLRLVRQTVADSVPSICATSTGRGVLFSSQLAAAVRAQGTDRGVAMFIRPFVSVVLVAVSLLAAAGIAVAASPAAARRPAPKAVPLPDQSLLEKQPPPQCRLSKAPEGINPNEALVVTLDYERQCYRQAEEIVRARLDALQEAVRDTVKTDNGSTVRKRVVRHERRVVHRNRVVRRVAKSQPAVDLGR